jgi:SNF2 family DNA or RNA helicase
MKVVANKKKKDIETGSMQDILRTFATSTTFPLLIVSYEQVRAYHTQLRDMQCDLLICDEGHRIKNAASQVGAALNSLRATRRVILSGTPIQNDLEEFFCMMNFCCPGLLGEQAQFKRKFATPLQAAREPSATPAVKGRGQQLTEELTALTGPFILRRTAAILEGYLPPKSKSVL